MIVGWIGVGILILSYVLLLTRYSKWFIPVDTTASYILTLHAVLINDLPFILVNGFIAIMLSIKWYKREMEVDK